MSSVSKQVQVAKSVDDVGAAVVGLISAVKALLISGQGAAGIPALVAAEAGVLISAVGEIGQIQGDLAADPVGCEKALALMLVDLKEVLKKS